MSQKVSRKSGIEDKDNKANSPVKEMKKKMAANAEKEKQAADKSEKVEKAPEKAAEKVTEKSDKPEKSDKSTDKKEKKDKDSDKKNEKPEPQAEKSKEESSSKDDKSQSEKEKPDAKKAEPKQKLNGRAHNGVSDVTLGNGTDEALNGTVSADSEDDDVMLVIDDHDHDELFPELTYDDTSDVECFEPPTPESAPSRSFTRRSQVKATRTPETPRPSDKQGDNQAQDPKDSKLLKLKDDTPATDRKLRSADSPKPESKKEEKNDADKDAKKDKDTEESKDVVGDKKEEVKSQADKKELEVVIEIESNEGDDVPRKPDTNYSKSRVKVSPYRRSTRLADQTNTSNVANYTGNNTTMEMDITESSSFMEETNLDDSSYLRGLRSIRGRSSYKQLKELTLRHVANRSARSTTSTTVTSPLVDNSRPTGTVVGRKRKTDSDDYIEVAGEVTEGGVLPAVPKRMRVLDRIAEPFRRVAAVTLPSAQRRNAEIVGINTDLPLSAPVASSETFDPESLKSGLPGDGPGAAPLPSATNASSATAHSENKRCAIM